METQTEKKWFVYLGDSHEGPFSIQEVLKKLDSGEVTESSYVWAEGMPDWKPMNEVTSFINTFKKASAPPTPPPSSGHTQAIHLSPVEEIDSGPQMTEVEPEPSINTSRFKKERSVVIKMDDRKSHSEDDEVPIEEEEDEDPKAKKKKKSKKEKTKTGSTAQIQVRGPKKRGRLIFLALLGGGVIGGFYGAVNGYLDPVLKNPAVSGFVGSLGNTLSSTIDSVPQLSFLSDLLSPIKRTEEMTEEDYKVLKAAASTSLPKSGAKAALGIAQDDPTTPVFLIGTNLPDGAEFEVIAEGIPDTLLNRLEFKGSTSGTANQKLARTKPMQGPDSGPVPKGEYKVTVKLSAKQNPEVQAAAGAASVLETKKVFLGGKKDARYKAALERFHEELKKRASDEMTELKMLADTLEAQLNESSAVFMKTRPAKGKPNPRQVRSWNDFSNGKWKQLMDRLSQDLTRLTPEVLQKEKFYWNLYPLLKAASDDVMKVHAFHQQYFTGTIEPTSYDIQRGQILEAAKTAVMIAKNKINAIAALPPTAAGLPNRGESQ